MPRKKTNTMSNKKRRKTLLFLLPHQHFPKPIRHELQITCALQCYSTVREGPKKTKTGQQDMLYDYYHGVANKYPSQIKLLSEGTSFYKDF